MKYRNFGKLDWQPSALGFGCMRLPTTDNQPLGANINEELVIRMIRNAIDKGVNYIDTAYPYHQGNSEIVVGKALQDGYRERVKLADKLPVWLVNEPADFDRLLDEQLHKLSTDHIDFYLLHALTRKRWSDIVLKHDLIKKAEAAIKDGRIRYLGFSFHDSYDVFEEIIKAYDWTFCQIQYNYMDISNQAGIKGLKLAASRGIGVVVMEPLLGGHLANPPASVRDAMDQVADLYTPADLALKWIWNQPEVSLVLSGMSSMEQVDENLLSADGSAVNSFTTTEKKAIAALRKSYRSGIAVPCTNCKYCMPCPHGVEIPANFEFFNHAYLYNDLAAAKFRYSIYLTPSQRSDKCIACKECEDKCPQKIEISSWMPKVTEMLSA
ncbi:MAG: aldo/keto reductase [Bacteroidetes bacterium]|nr:aldo/keto reductase [Bacteroidota bacterium]